MRKITIDPPGGLRESYIIKVDGKVHWTGYSEVRRNSILAILGCRLNWFERLLLWTGLAIVAKEVA